MPSVKRSETVGRKYGGKRENLELTYAIEFLFQIKGQEYKKKHPGFIIPSAHEFLEYSKNPEKPEKSEKQEKHKKTKESEEFIKFLLYIAPPIGSNRELLCVSIVVLAIVLYIFTTDVIETAIENTYTLTYEQVCQKVAAHLKTDEGMNLFIHPLSYFFTHYLTKQNKLKEYLYNLAVDSIRKTTDIIPTLCLDESILVEHDIHCMRIGHKLIEHIQFIFKSYMEVISEPIVALSASKDTPIIA